jgi:predicted RNA binding protein YcfA (HicA-like mRNA interferase family)
MSDVPRLPYTKIIAALQRGGFVVVRQRGSHIRLQKRTETELLKITVPAHKPVKRTTLAKIIKQAKFSLDEFKDRL